MRRALLQSCWCCFLVASGAGSSGQTAELKVGVAAVKITPPLGVPMAGYYTERLAEKVHDDLHSKAIVLEADGVRAALVALDLIGTPRGTVEKARLAIEQTTHIKGANVMISATHAHTGP